jgi:hypothetical protein
LNNLKSNKIKENQSNKTSENQSNNSSANQSNKTESKSKSTSNESLKSEKNKVGSRYIVVGGRVIEIKTKTSLKSSPKNGKDTLMNSDQFRAKIVSDKGNYYVVGGSYLTENAAKIEIRKWNKLKKEATYFHIAESSLIKIVLKRFKSQKEATEFAVTIKDIPAQTISVQELKLIK